MKKLTKETFSSEECLDYLKEIFYKINDFDCVNEKKLNKCLNFFYGLNVNESADWKKEFKSSIKTKNENQKLINISNRDLDKIEPRDIINQAFIKKKEISEKLESFYKNAIDIESTIIYEAPPFLILIDNKDEKPNLDFVAKFIFDEQCDSPYSNAIRGCFENKTNSIMDILKENKCGFLDVIPMPLPINSDLRNKWATEEKFIINGKKIFVHFFEWAIENYKNRVKFSENKKHQIAVGIPLNNAITLYEYFNIGETVNFGESLNEKILFNEGHSIDFKNKKIGLWIHPYKNCIISTSNTPNAELMKLAFN
jgi:hypothetical protein